MHLYGDDINKFRMLGVLIYFHEVNLMFICSGNYLIFLLLHLNHCFCLNFDLHDAFEPKGFSLITQS